MEAANGTSARATELLAGGWGPFLDRRDEARLHTPQCSPNLNFRAAVIDLGLGDSCIAGASRPRLSFRLSNSRERTEVKLAMAASDSPPTTLHRLVV